jgi:hypothetical protein
MEKISSARPRFRPMAGNWWPGPKAITARVDQPADAAWCARRALGHHARGRRSWPVLVGGLGWWCKLEGVSGHAPGKGKRWWSSPSIGAVARRRKRGHAGALCGGGSAPVAGGDLWGLGAVAAGAQCDSILWLSGGGGYGGSRWRLWGGEGDRCNGASARIWRRSGAPARPNA